MDNFANTSCVLPPITGSGGHKHIATCQGIITGTLPCSQARLGHALQHDVDRNGALYRLGPTNFSYVPTITRNMCVPRRTLQPWAKPHFAFPGWPSGLGYPWPWEPAA